jgi:hypothetical protein
MTFVGFNYWAILVAGVVGFLIGGVWYRLLAAPWKAAHGFTTEQIRAHHGKGAAPWPLITAFVADLAMAWVLAGLLAHTGFLNVKDGLISAAIVWTGFVLTTLTVNNVFGMRKPVLILIDGGHWLVVLLAMGAIIGGWGL